jgi:hypothetical protein
MSLRFAPGDLVLIRGLQQQSQLNNTIGAIQDFAESSQRYRVLPSQGRTTYLIQQDNLTQRGIVKPSDRPFRTQRCWSHLCFWPSIKDGDGTTITPVQAFHNGIEHNIRDRPKFPFFFARRSIGKILINCPALYNTARPNRPLSCTLMLAIPPVPTTRRHNNNIVDLLPLLLPHDVHYHFHHGLNGTKRVRSRAPKVHPAAVARRPTVPSNGTGATTISRTRDSDPSHVWRFHGVITMLL